MSNRVIQRLREEEEERKKQQRILEGIESSSSSEEESDDEEYYNNKNKNTNTFLYLSDDDDSEDESDADEHGDDSDVVVEDTIDSDVLNTSNEHVSKEATMQLDPSNNKQGKKTNDTNENLDAILDEFKLFDENKTDTNTNTSNNNKNENEVSMIHSILLSQENLNIRNFDLDYTLQSLLGATGADNNANAPVGNGNIGGRNNRTTIKRKYLFGGDTTSHRPPHYIGGGMGMKQHETTTTNQPKVYQQQSNQNTTPNEPKWYAYEYSDVYKALEEEYESLTSSGGDINLLAMFLADHPFHTRSLLQLSTVLYKTGDADKGKDLLQRCLQVYECASYHSLFYPTNNKNTNTPASYNYTIAPVLMDIALVENESFFLLLFRFMHISCMVGCIPTSFVVARLLLSLDPLRDPMGVLLVLDYYALACGNETFLIHLVHSKALQIYHEDCTPCSLLTLPNFAYSYALALFRSSHTQYNKSEQQTSTEQDEQKQQEANEALQYAIRTYPSIVTLLLKKNNVNIHSRTTHVDWGGVLPNLPTSNNALLISHPVLLKIIDIFIMKQAPLWSSDHVIQWLYTNCESITTTTSTQEEQKTPSEQHPEEDISAINRYQSCDPSDYSNTTTTLPAEFNPLDERLVAPALIIDPNRRRMLRGHVQQQQEQQQQQWMMMQNDQRNMMQQYEDGHYNRIDPDDPLMQVFLQSLLPWNTVPGIPRTNL